MHGLDAFFFFFTFGRLLAMVCVLGCKKKHHCCACLDVEMFGTLFIARVGLFIAHTAPQFVPDACLSVPRHGVHFFYQSLFNVLKCIVR
jgi:hypothetical protein